jgi:hypothetical protein
LTTANDYVVTVRLGHTTLSALAGSFAANFNSGAPVTVASGLSFKVPAGIPVGHPIWIPLSGVFNYNGTDNLIVDIEVSGARAPPAPSCARMARSRGGACSPPWGM